MTTLDYPEVYRTYRLRVFIGYLGVTIGHLRVVKGHLRIVNGHLKVYIFFSLLSKLNNKTELHPKVC